MDTRWPHLVDVSGIPGLHQADRQKLARACDSIYSRTDFRCLFNRITETLHFYISDPDMGAALPKGALLVFDQGGQPRTHKFDSLWIDNICGMLQAGRTPRHLKDRDIAFRETSRKSDVESQKSREWTIREKEARKTARRVTNRMGMSSKFKPSVLVNGLKGSVK